jgi:transcriptional regulator with XRE-family HTH domain
MESFNDLFQRAQKTDSYWAEKIILKFTNQLYRLLKNKNLSKKEFAEKIGTSQAYITKVLRGDANFTIETMVKLTRALDGSLEIQVMPKEENVAWYKVISDRKKQVRQAESWAVECQETPCSIEEGNNGYAIAS